MLVGSELEHEQSALIRQLLQIFPLSIRALKGDSNAPVRVTIRDQRLPLRSADIKSKCKVSCCTSDPNIDERHYFPGSHRVGIAMPYSILF